MKTYRKKNSFIFVKTCPLIRFFRNFIGRCIWFLNEIERIGVLMGCWLLDEVDGLNGVLLPDDEVDGVNGGPNDDEAESDDGHHESHPFPPPHQQLPIAHVLGHYNKQNNNKINKNNNKAKIDPRQGPFCPCS